MNNMDDPNYLEGPKLEGCHNPPLLSEMMIPSSVDVHRYSSQVKGTQDCQRYLCVKVMMCSL